MTRKTLEEVKRAWSRGYEGLSEDEIDRRAEGFAVLVRGIAQRGAVSSSVFGDVLGLAPAAARELFGVLARAGVELDEAGSITGAALTTKRTPHAIRLAGRTLFAWCALDTLFIPGLIGEAGQIESTCPVSGETIRLTVLPDRITSRAPVEIWLSVFVPDGSAGEIGPASPT